MRCCAVSVDLDEIPNYLAIHGIELDAVNTDAVYDIAVPRLMQWAKQRECPLTLFAVGSDMRRSANAQVLRHAAQAGHEIGNHSFHHFYDLTRRSLEEQRQEVRLAADALEQATGQRPKGFRAPGYTTTDELYRALELEGVTYSSSVFPCPGYYGAKALAIGLKGLFGKRSQSIVDDPRVLTAPPGPYRIGAPYWRRGGNIVELPIQTTRYLRLPFIGTSITMAGPSGARWLARGVQHQALVNLELHGIDVLDDADGLAALGSVQYDVRIPLERKLASLDAALDVLKASGYEFRTLGEVALAADKDAS